MASKNSSKQPTASKNFSEQPMASQNSSEEPIASKNSSEQPLRSEEYGRQPIRRECEEEPMDIDHHEHNEVEPMEVDEEEMSAEQFHSLYQRYLQLQQERAKVDNNPFITPEKKRVMINHIQHEYNIVMNGNQFPLPNNHFESPPNNPFNSPPNNPFNSPPNNLFNSPPNNSFNSPPNNPFNSPPNNPFKSLKDTQKTPLPLFTSTDNAPQTFQQAVAYFNQSQENIPFASKERWDRFESFGSRFMIDSTYPNDIEMEDLSEEPLTADHIEQDHREEMKYDNDIEMEDLSEEPLPTSFHHHGEEVKTFEEHIFAANNAPHQNFALPNNQRMDSPNCQIMPQLHVSQVNPNNNVQSFESQGASRNLDTVTVRNGHCTIDHRSKQISSFIPCKEPAAYPNNRQTVEEEKITSKAATTNQNLQDNPTEEDILILQKEIENKKSLLKFLKTEFKLLKKEAFPDKDKKKLIENEMNDAAKDLSKLKRKLPKSLRPIRLQKNDGSRKMERSLVGAGFDGDCASSFKNLSPPSIEPENNFFINTPLTRRFQ
ncbi:uncharacterized protein [Clytia hemisphaerica]|uniref:uncharacterized protein n=1 Tax=Clytia hemisphaerica TaxID=252671 RepID=UPI0034D5B26B